MGGETTRCRARLAKFCNGNGLDLGHGCDPITPKALRISIEPILWPRGDYINQFAGDASRLYWFSDNVLDFVYSSHLLEDFVDTEKVLREWLRVLKKGGRLVIYCPDEQRFREHCKKTGQPYNHDHKHANFSLRFVLDILDKIGGTKTIHSLDPAEVYSWDLVVEKV